MICIFFPLNKRIFRPKKYQVACFLSFPSLSTKKMSEIEFRPCPVNNSYLRTGTPNDLHLDRADVHQWISRDCLFSFFERYL